MINIRGEKQKKTQAALNGARKKNRHPNT